MILLENKLAIFNKMVYLKKENECKEKIHNANKNKEDAIAKKEKELDEMSKDLISRRENLAKQKGNELIAKVNEDKRIFELQKDDELLDKLIVELSNKLVEFTKTQDYIEFQKRRFTDVTEDLPKDNYIVSVLENANDEIKNSFKEIANSNGFEIEFSVLPKDKLGGFIITNSDKTYNIDCSLREKIEDSKYEIGKLLHFTLKRAGDEN